MKTLPNAFDYIINLHGFNVELIQKANTYNIKMAYSNYHRNLENVSDTVTYGREFVTTDKSLKNSGATAIKRGDTISTPQGKFSVIEVIPMVVTAGVVVGYRIRTN